MRLLGLLLGVGVALAQAQNITTKSRVCVNAVEGLHVRANPSLTAPILTTALNGEAFTVAGGPTAAGGVTWWQLNAGGGWADGDYLEVCGGAGSNVFGVGLVSPGSDTQYDLVHGLAGDNGWIMLLFPGITSTSTSADPTWIDAVNQAYSRNMNVVARLNPPWGSSNYRDESDDPAHRNYTTLANAFRAVVASLPRVNGRNLYLQIDNEPDLCYEWFCNPGEAQPLQYAEMAAEYASFYKYVVLAIRSLGDSRIKVAYGALAPGGARQCGCCGSQNCPADQGGITGLTYMDAMVAAVPDIWSYVDFLATHSYPASGIGFGFNCPLDQATPGLTYYQLELQKIGRSLQVLVTETGWATNAPGLPTCTEQNKADWTVGAYKQVWLNDSAVMGVMPFMLQDATWGDQDGWEYVMTNGQIMPVYNEVQQLRCSLGFGPC